MMNKQVDGVSLLGQTVIDIEFTPGAMMVDKVLRANEVPFGPAVGALLLWLFSRLSEADQLAGLAEAAPATSICHALLVELAEARVQLVSEGN